MRRSPRAQTRARRRSVAQRVLLTLGGGVAGATVGMIVGDMTTPDDAYLRELDVGGRAVIGACVGVVVGLFVELFLATAPRSTE